MNRRNDIARLQMIAGLLLDHRLALLHAASEAKARTEEKLAGLAADQQIEGLEGAAGALAGLAYKRWADVRRAEINLVLARETRDWLDAQDRAREAFGKSVVLDRIAAVSGKP